MSETTNQGLSGVAETSLIALYLRAMETQRPDALIKDEKAVELVTRMSHDFDFIKQIPMKEVNKVVPLLRNREFDRYARDFLARHPPDCLIGVSRRGGRDTTPHNRPKLSLPGGHNVPDVHWHTNKTVRGFSGGTGTVGPALFSILFAAFAWATGVFQWLWPLATWLFSGGGGRCDGELNH
jgi:hypothetical protein